MASTSSPTTPSRKHDVFLSFSGKDTRYSFTSHLYDALQRNQIDAFIDKQLDKGEKLEPALLKRIEDSYISVVIFSKNYADSTFCLRELSKIHECMETKGQIVLPVFHQLDPSQVQNLKGRYGKALSRHERDCASEVKSWRRALKKVAIHNGWDSSDIKDETELIEKIVSHIQSKLHHAPSTPIDAKGLVGIQSRVKDIESLLSFGSTGVLIVGIWGMGGIGKSTTAEDVYNRNSHKFKGRYFFRNVREKSNKKGVFHVRQKILGGVLEKKVPKIDTKKLPQHIKQMLQRKKVLIVLDDVSDAQDLKILVGEDGLFGEGSRIIVTSRDRQVLINACQEENIYEVKELDEGDALRLFTFHAFKPSNPPNNEFTRLSENVVRCVKGIPLVLVVLGASLNSKTSVEYWESKVAQLRTNGGEDIKKCLGMCYDELDRTEKKIFLDIACFFGRCKRDYLQQTLDPEERSGIDRLIDMCLIKIVEENRIWMHDVLLQLGKDIVVQENVADPSERSRLWDVDDFERVLASPGTTKVESISLWIFGNTEIDISPAAFEGMKNLRLLQFFYPSKKRGRIHLRQGLHFLSNELRILEWWKYPLKSLPSNFSPKKLAVLKMPFSELEQLWNEYQPLLENLKLMDLSGSSKLILSDFDFSNLLNFEVLNLGESVDDLDANNLCTLPPSIGVLSQLVKLDLSFCSSLTCLPDSIGELKSQLVKLDLSFCGSLTCLPGSIGELKSLVELDLWYCSKLASLPSSIGNLTCLVKLKLSGCYELASLPLLPSSLQVLDASNCISLTSVEGIIMQGEKDYEAASQQFNFSHCPKLDQSSLTKIIGAHSRIQRMATSLFNQQYVGVRVCIPGSEVPEWFTYKNTGGPTVQIPVHWHRASTTNQLFGFTLCAVVSFGSPQKYVEDLSEEDRSEEYVIEEDLNEEDLSEEDRSEEYVNEEDLNEEDLREEDRSEEYVNEEDLNEEDLREEDLSDLSEEDSSEEDFSEEDLREEDTLPSRAYIHEQYPLPRDFDIKCECHLITKDGTQSDLSFHYYEGNEKRWGTLERKHVFIWSIHSDLFFKEASFHFKLLGENTAHAVVQSGVNPLFVEQQQRKRQKLSSI